ncbi:MAG: hypothetical protein PSN34_06440 [Urechidicola sp.]|nr:hypothetical protein [Urechidicola sp.]
MIKVQEITLEYQKLGLFNTKIFKDHIKEQFNMSKRTFDEYLGIPAKKELKELDEAARKQLNMFENE